MSDYPTLDDPKALELLPATLREACRDLIVSIARADIPNWESAGVVALINGLNAYARKEQANWQESDQPWSPIATAPKDGTLVDLWVAGPRNAGSRETDCWFENGAWHRDYGRDGISQPAAYIDDQPTHWMPLPPAPRAA